jgi:hypothetical protein
MNTHFGSSLSIKNYQSDKYGSSQWITNANILNSNLEYKLYPTHKSTISGGREYIALPSDTKITWQMKEKYNLS